MISIMSFIICFGFCLMKLVGQPLNRLPVTLYRPDWAECGNTDETNDYYEIPFCESAVPPNSTQLQVSLEVPDNPDFKPTPANLICIQLSTCKGDFSPPCGFATNCQFNGTNGQIYGFPNLVINNDRYCPDISNCTLFIRAMARPNNAEYSLQVTFVDSKSEDYIVITAGQYSPWHGPVTNGDPKELSQYWRNDQIYEASTKEFTYFYIGYCPQKTPVSAIEIAVISPVDNTVTLLQVFACTPNLVTNYDLCTTEQNSFSEDYVAPFVVLRCPDSQGKPLDKGLYVVVYTLGNSTNQQNQFIFQAIINPPQSSQIKLNKTNKYKL